MCVCRDGHCPSAKNGRPMVVPTMSIRGWWVVVGVDAHIDPCANMRAVEDARPYGVYPRSVRVRRGGYHPPETGDRRRRKIVLTTHLRCACPNMAYRHIPTSQRFSTIAPTESIRGWCSSVGVDAHIDPYTNGRSRTPAPTDSIQGHCVTIKKSGLLSQPRSHSV